MKPIIKKGTCVKCAAKGPVYKKHCFSCYVTISQILLKHLDERYTEMEKMTKDTGEYIRENSKATQEKLLLGTKAIFGSDHDPN